MSEQIKILHIDLEYGVTYFVKGPQLTIRTTVPLQSAIEILKKEDFDLIIFEPLHKAFLKEPLHSLTSGPVKPGELLNMGADNVDFKIRPPERVH